MPNWKRAIILGTFIGGAFLIIKGRRGTGLAIAGVGAAVLASEYPEKVEELWERAPEYLERGAQVLSAISRIKERIAEEGPRVISGAWKQVADY